MALAHIEKNIQQYTDTELVTAILDGHTALFEIVIRRYNPFLYKIGRSYGFNHHDTEDLMQEAFINSYLKLEQFANRSSLKTWIVKIMLNQCYHKSQKHSYQKEQLIESIPDHASVMNQINPQSDNGKTVIKRELNSIIETCIQKLPKEYRTTFTLRELLGLSVAETADSMQTTASNVKVRLNRAKALLRKEIEKIYTPEDIYEFNLVYCDRIVNAVMQNIYEIERRKK
ncbi:sigma-70 family RNA polymerase sigma factor [Flavisolibacter tropicus]|uniref:RNA polymerase subunit sigma-24 n=1 Tax=Flavisolibacter tropicus TaxID=1492898 RepID=A0A172TX67_9BACT|nr:sigma-70 family RNA polymerase sigma factor [Flavisolibacter tropicus]ANE51327.1 RNA polymerase subunit sigma-24 [Flavisolibacter tropicus]